VSALRRDECRLRVGKEKVRPLCPTRAMGQQCMRHRTVSILPELMVVTHKLVELTKRAETHLMDLPGLLHNMPRTYMH
jgi:hypothetical protein